MFSYKAQVDDAMDEDTVSLPHQQSFSSLKTDSDYIYQVHTPSVHIPLYDSQASKPPKLNPRPGAYSLSPSKYPKSDSSVLASPRLYHSASGIRSIDRNPSIEKGTSELAKHPLMKSSVASVTQKSVPDLRSNLYPNQKDDSVARVEYGGGSSSVADTASNYLYSPKVIDSNVNLYSQTRKGSLESRLDSTTVDGAAVPGRRDSFPEVPALENTLQVILESGTYEIKTEDFEEESRLKTSEGSAADANSSYLTTRFDAEYFKSRPDNTDVSESNVTRQLLPNSTSFRITSTCDWETKTENQSGGLSEYLLSITSPHKRHKEYEMPDPFSDSDS